MGRALQPGQLRSHACSEHADVTFFSMPGPRLVGFGLTLLMLAELTDCRRRSTFSMRMSLCPSGKLYR